MKTLAPEEAWNTLVGLPEDIRSNFIAMGRGGEPTHRIAAYLESNGMKRWKAIALTGAYHAARFSEDAFRPIIAGFNARAELVKLYRQQENRLYIESAREERAQEYSDNVTKLQTEARSTLESIAKIDIALGFGKMLIVQQAEAAAERQGGKAVADRLESLLGDTNASSRRRIAEVAPRLLERIFSEASMTEVVDK